jgi:hypothetical protein
MEYLVTVKKQGEHGQIFAYREPNINVLTFVIQRVANRDLRDLVSERFWQHIGAEHDGLYMVDPAGCSTTAARTLRDYLRFGELMRTGGTTGVVNTAIMNRLVSGGDPLCLPRLNIQRDLWMAGLINPNGGSVIKRTEMLLLPRAHMARCFILIRQMSWWLPALDPASRPPAI